MADPFRGEIVERLAVARAGAGLGRGFGDRRRPRRIGQRLGGQEVAAAAGTVRVPPAPDLGRPVGRPPVAAQHGAHARHHRRADRLEPELFFPPPAHPHRRPRPLHRDRRRVGRRVVGAVMAVAARPLRVMHDDRRRIELQGPRQRGAQRVHPLRMRPYFEPAVAVHGDAAGRRDRGVRQVHPRETRLAPSPSRRGPGRPAARRFRGRARAAATASAPPPETG